MSSFPTKPRFEPIAELIIKTRANPNSEPYSKLELNSSQNPTLN